MNNPLLSKEHGNYIKVSVESDLATVTLDRVEKRNAFNLEMWKEIKSQGLIGWYSVTTASIHVKGDKVKRWTNMISNGYNFRQGIADNMPLYDASENAVNGGSVRVMITHKSRNMKKTELQNLEQS